MRVGERGGTHLDNSEGGAGSGWSESLGGRGERGEEWEGLLCQETERERENQHLSTAC